jgi:chaperonin cofactor prefoldin
MSTYNEREKRLDDLKNKITTLKKEMRDLEHELYKMNEENDFLEFMSTRNDNIQINNI